jgi:hypothetical protein
MRREHVSQYLVKKVRFKMRGKEGRFELNSMDVKY